VFCLRPDRPLLATFDQPHASSDGGAILLKAADRQMGLPVALTATVPDARALARVHGVGDLLAKRLCDRVSQRRSSLLSWRRFLENDLLERSRVCWEQLLT
jgi:hypothetical protein